MLNVQQVENTEVLIWDEMSMSSHDKSQLFDKVFPHPFKLAKVLRQQHNQIRFKEALDLLRLGKCDDTELYLRSRGSCPQTKNGKKNLAYLLQATAMWST